MAKLDRDVLASLPVSRGVSDALSTALSATAAALGDDLVMIAIYGGVARGEWDEKTSDVNVMCVARTLDFGTLGKLASVVQTARKKGNISIWFLTEDEVQQSADVYCVKFADIRRHHIVVAGEDLLADLTIERTHFRFVAEFELRNAALRLRRHFLITHGKRLEQHLLVDHYTSTLVPLRALAELLGHDVARETSAAIPVIGEALGADVSSLKRLHELHRTGSKASSGELERLFAGLADVVTTAVDKLEAADT